MVGKFPRKMRLKLRRDFKRAFGARCVVSDDNLVIYLSRNGLDVTRLGLAVGRKLGQAVTRNRIKRLLREAFRRRNIGTATPGLDLICRPKSGQIRTLAEYEASLQDLVAQGARKLQRQAGKK